MAENLAELLTTDGIISLLTLAVLEIILGIDNIIFISIISNKLPEEQRKSARQLGILMALAVRIALLFAISWIIGLTKPLFTLGFLTHLQADPEITGRDLVLLLGGLFLIYKSISEIHDKVKLDHEEHQPNKLNVGAAKKGLAHAIVQIIAIDVVFSFDSILTAIGLVENILIMIIAVVISLVVMLIFAGKIAGFVEKNPPIKMIALAFLVLIGFLLVVDAFGHHVPKGYIYFALTFSLGIELLNMKYRKKTQEEQLLELVDDD